MLNTNEDISTNSCYFFHTMEVNGDNSNCLVTYILQNIVFILFIIFIFGKKGSL